MQKTLNGLLYWATIYLGTFIVTTVAIGSYFTPNFDYQSHVVELAVDSFCPGERIYYRNEIVLSRLPIYINEETEILNNKNDVVLYTKQVLILLQGSLHIPRNYALKIPANLSPGKYTLSHAIRSENSNSKGFYLNFFIPQGCKT